MGHRTVSRTPIHVCGLRMVSPFLLCKCNYQWDTQAIDYSWTKPWYYHAAQASSARIQDVDVILIWRLYLPGVEPGILRSLVGRITGTPWRLVSNDREIPDSTPGRYNLQIKITSLCRIKQDLSKPLFPQCPLKTFNITPRHSGLFLFAWTKFLARITFVLVGRVGFCSNQRAYLVESSLHSISLNFFVWKRIKFLALILTWSWRGKPAASTRTS